MEISEYMRAVDPRKKGASVGIDFEMTESRIQRMLARTHFDSLILHFAPNNNPIAFPKVFSIS